VKGQDFKWPSILDAKFRGGSVSRIRNSKEILVLIDMKQFQMTQIEVEQKHSKILQEFM